VIRPFGKALVAVIALGCGGRAPDVLVVTPEAAAPSAAARATRGTCRRGPVRYAPPPGARTLATPAPERTFSLEGSAPGAWVEADAGPGAPLAGVWSAGADVYAVGSGRLLRSRDGGRSFEEGTSPLPADAVWGSERDVFLVAGRSFARSGDGGGTWSVHEPFAEDALVSAIAGEGPDLWAVGSTSGGDAYAAHSGDRGATWQRLALPFAGGSLDAIALRPGAAGDPVVLLGGHARGAPNRPVLLESADCGATWKRRALPEGDESGAGGGGPHDAVRGLCALPRAVVVAARRRLAILPDDSAATADTLTPDAEITALACSGDEILVGAADGTLFASGDGGRTWRADVLAALPRRGAPSHVRAISVSDDGSAYVAGDGAGGRGALVRRSPR
jgi:photosystem II stability/assembly factor-like uncharacterized protein